MQQVFIDDQVFALMQATSLRHLGGVGVVEYENLMNVIHPLLQLQAAVYMNDMIRDSTFNCLN